jgi:hypothetical protein
MHSFVVFQIFSQVLDKYRVYDQLLNSCVEIHIDDLHLFSLHPELTSTAEYWIKFCT